jgi:hypothetical protein
MVEHLSILKWSCHVAVIIVAFAVNLLFEILNLEQLFSILLHIQWTFKIKFRKINVTNFN